MLALDSLLSVALPLLLLRASPTAAKEEACTARHGKRFYDLRPLKSKKDYHFQSPSGLNFSLNVCRALSDDTWHVAEPAPNEIAATVRRAHGDFALGAVNTTLDVRAGSPVLTFTGGSECPKAKDSRAAAVVRFVCDRGFGTGPMEGSGKGKPQLVAQIPFDDESACNFVVEWRTQYACAADQGYGFWGIVGIILLALLGIFALYISLGALYRRFVLHYRGIDQLPPFTPAHAGEMFSFARDALDDVWSRRSDPFDRYGAAWSGWNISTGSRGTTAGSGGRTRNGYSQVPAEREETEAMIGSDEESDDEDVESGRAPPAAAGGGLNGGATNTGQRPQGMSGDGVIRL